MLVAAETVPSAYVPHLTKHISLGQTKGPVDIEDNPLENGAGVPVSFLLRIERRKPAWSYWRCHCCERSYTPIERLFRWNYSETIGGSQSDSMHGCVKAGSHCWYLQEWVQHLY